MSWNILTEKGSPIGRARFRSAAIPIDSMTAMTMFKYLQRPAVPQACNCGHDILPDVGWDT
jgi:hypothetical protein